MVDLRINLKELNVNKKGKYQAEKFVKIYLHKKYVNKWHNVTR